MDEHLDQLIALPPIGSSTDVTGLRGLYDRVKFRTSSLEDFGKRVLLNRMLLRSLPEGLVIMYRLNMVNQMFQLRKTNPMLSFPLEQIPIKRAIS